MGGCGGQESNDSFTVSHLGACAGFKLLILRVLHLGGCGGLAITDFKQLLLSYGVVVLKELIFYSFYLGRV